MAYDLRKTPKSVGKMAFLVSEIAFDLRKTPK